jgi:hypothetical protein
VSQSSAPADADRCAVAKFDVRCQLVIGHDGVDGDDGSSPHVAMARRPGRPAGYMTWTQFGLGESSWNPAAGPQAWALSFPRIE